MTRLLLPVLMATMLGACVQIAPHSDQMMTRDQMLRLSTHVFIGVIEKHEEPNKLLIRVSGEDAEHWRVLARRVRVEMVLKGVEPRRTIDVYETFPVGGLSGDWNATQDNVRYLFPVRLENGRYRLTRDFWRSIFPVGSGRHHRLPLNDSAPLWERFALLQWWIPASRSALGDTFHSDPGQVFGLWREAKVLRGLLRHPHRQVRLDACEHLLHMAAVQDECWETLSPGERHGLMKFTNVFPAEDAWRQNRSGEKYARQRWDQLVRQPTLSREAMDDLRLFTTMNNRTLRREFCAKFLKRFPEDKDHGCPADQPPPATIVTQDGDVPLTGPWPG